MWRKSQSLTTSHHVCTKSGFRQYLKKFFQSFQRIQRNRQSRIRVKLCRKAGKRQDEILEEDASNEDDIDIVGEEKEEENNEEKNESDKKTHKQGLYGPDQFTEADVLAIANELEKEEPVNVNVCDDTGDVKETNIKQEADGCQKKWCSQCQVSERAHSRNETERNGFLRS